MSVLAFYRTRILQVLDDPTGTRYDPNAVDEALRQALMDISAAYPQVSLANITVSTPGSIQPLSGVGADFMVLLQVIYPYHADDRQHPVYDAWYSFSLDGTPAVYFNAPDVPQENEVFQVVYGRRHTIQNLDGAGVTSLAAGHEEALCRGAAGYALRSQAGGMVHTYAGVEPSKELAAMGDAHLTDFRKWLLTLHFCYPTTGGWALDEWDAGG